MSVDLQMLIASATLCVLLALPYTMGFIFTRGLFTVVGNREDFPASHGWMGRSHRAHLNMVENLVPFAALILAAQASGQAADRKSVVEGTSVAVRLDLGGRR